jgi:SAM-dependent methyltransferase
MEILAYNREAWTREAESGNKWTIPVDSRTIEGARRGEWSIFLTPTIPVPREWFGRIEGRDILCLASGGGQQGPVLAAAGARVTVFDACPAQLERDRGVALREGLELRLVQGDMRDLAAFPDGSFDLVFHPVSNCFVDEIERVWKECFRILRKGGVLLAGFVNPLVYIFDQKAWDEERLLSVKYRIPYSDVAQRPPEELAALTASRKPLEFGHSLDAQIGGQIAAGFSIAGFFEDKGGYDPADADGGDFLDPYISTFIATRAIRYQSPPALPA